MSENLVEDFFRAFTRTSFVSRGPLGQTHTHKAPKRRAWEARTASSGAAAVESAAVSAVVVRSCVWVRWWVEMVVWFVCVIRVPVCARAPRVCPVRV